MIEKPVTRTLKTTRPAVSAAGRAGLILAALAALVAAATLSACGTSVAPTADQATMTQAARLALGTINLEGTDQAVDEELAVQLLPLWQLLGDLSASNTAAPEERAVVVDALQSTMSAEQLAAIDDQNISDAAIAAATQPSGAASTGEAAAPISPSDAQIDPALGGEMGGETAGLLGDAGGMPMDGMPSGGSFSASGGTTAGAARSANPGTTALIKEVIVLLESKIES